LSGRNAVGGDIGGGWVYSWVEMSKRRKGNKGGKARGWGELAVPWGDLCAKGTHGTTEFVKKNKRACENFGGC